jgi:hypothetical protein
MYKKIESPLELIGYTLLVFTIVLLLFLFIVLIKMIVDPSSIGIIEALVGTTELGDGLGTLITIRHQENDYNIRIDRSVMYFLYFISAAMLVGALAALFKTLVSGGISLVQYAKSPLNDNEKQ